MQVKSSLGELAFRILPHDCVNQCDDGHKWIGSSPEHFQHRPRESCCYSAIALFGQVHPVPAERLIAQINGPAEIDIAKSRLAGESKTEQILQFLLLYDVLVGKVRLADDQNLLAFAQCKICRGRNSITVELPFRRTRSRAGCHILRIPAVERSQSSSRQRR